jgi:hypothetical protein
MWLEMIQKLQLVTHADAERLQGEANELTAIFVASRRTAMSRRKNRRN